MMKFGGTKKIKWDPRLRGDDDALIMKKPFSFHPVLLGAMVTLLGACAVGPDYQRPPFEAPPAFKEAGEWKKAAPQDDAARGAWWRVYNDPVLDSLMDQVLVSNENIKASEAAWRQARATVDETDAALFPTLTLDAASTKSGTGASPKTVAWAHKAGAGASWEPDIWGGTRRSVEASEASFQASAANLAATKLAMQAALAQAYFDLRATDSLKTLLDATVAAYGRTLTIVENQYKQGVVAFADVAAAKTQLEAARALATGAALTRAQNEHAIAGLIGKVPAAFSLGSAPLTGEAPPVPAELSSVLLERRPDVAVAERGMAAANAQIGVETAAFFPNVTLSASYGYAATALSKLFQASNSLWSFGPAIGETVFDAGAREARLEEAKAGYDKSVASYRQTVLNAFQEVEDDLAGQRLLAEQEAASESALKNAQLSEKLALNQYQAGLVPYSSVVTAQVARLSAAQTALTLRQNRFLTSVSLIAALGGGWDGKMEEE
jgi:NodT family efflux transporter outer membrane factor (OMF) lipoprotein